MWKISESCVSTNDTHTVWYTERGCRRPFRIDPTDPTLSTKFMDGEVYDFMVQQRIQNNVAGLLARTFTKARIIV